MKLSIEQELDYDKLIKEIKKFLDLYKYPEQPYLFMSQETLDEFMKKGKVDQYRNGHKGEYYWEYLTCRIFVLKELDYGEIDIR